MKVKLQLDAKSIQAFALQNVEKIGFGVVALLCLFMVYRAVAGMKGYDRKPDQLVQEVRKGEQTIEQSKLDPHLVVKDYVALAEQTRKRVLEQPYDTLAAWAPPLFPPRRLRTDPALFAAQQLRGTAEVGPMNMLVSPADAAPAPAAPDARKVAGGPEAPAGAGAPMAAAVNETRLQRWAVVTALVPVEKQEGAFNEALKKSVYYDPQNDFPQYGGYLVERVEAPGPSEAADPDWTKAKKSNSFEEMRKAMSQWAQGMTVDVVAPEYIDEYLTFPLGPLVGRPWGESVAHPAEIPVLNPNDIHGGMGGLGGGMMPPGGNMRPGGMIPPGGNIGPGGGMMPMPGGGMGGIGPGGAMRPRGRGNTRGNPFGDPGVPNAGQPIAPGQNPAELKPPAFLLLRFFDYTVEPGKHYVYRVRLMLANPNYIPPAGAAADAGAAGLSNLKPAYLKDPKLAEKQWLETDWSEPSPVISVPRDTRVLALSVNPSRGNADIMLAKWVQRGFEAFHEFPVVRGQVANFLDSMFTHNDAGNLLGAGGRMAGGPEMPFGPGMAPPGMPGADAGGAVPGRRGTVPAARGGRGAVPGVPGAPAPATPGRGGGGRMQPGIGPDAGMPFGPGGVPGMGGGMMGPTGPNRRFKVNYYSSTIAIDYRGGDRLSGRGKLTAPGEILLWEPDGTLVVRSELDDKAAVEQLRAVEAPPAPAAMAPGAGGAGAVLPHRGGPLDNLLPPDNPDTRRRPARPR